MIDLEDNPLIIGGFEWERHEGQLTVRDAEDYEAHYYPVDYFPNLIDALYHFKDKGFDIKLSGAEFKMLCEGSHASFYVGDCDKEICPDISLPCDECKHHKTESVWVNFNRYDFIEGYGRFRRLVLIRDDYTCVCCGNDNEKDLQVHHIRSFKNNLELATSVKNGVTLCKKCHKKYHKKYGWNGKQETFSKFIKEMLD